MDTSRRRRGDRKLEPRVLGEHAVLGRRLAEDARPEPEEQIEPLVGIERAVLRTTLGASHDHGPMTVFHIVSADVLSVVLQTASPRPTSSRARPGRGLRRRIPGVRDVLAHAADPASSRRRTRGRAKQCHGRHVDGDVLGVPLGFVVEEMEFRREAHALDRRLERPLGNPRTASVFDTTRSSCDGVVVGAHGTTTRRSSTCRGRLLEPVDGAPSDHDHAIAGVTRRSRSATAHTVAPSAISRNERCSMIPSLLRKVSARRLGSRASASTTSRVKLKRSGICQRPSTSAGRRASSSGELAGAQAPAAPSDAKTFTA